MLRSITLRDFRAFRKQEFKFSKINILAGKNNSGKSSVLSAINLIAQTAIEREIGGSPLVLNGQYDQLGTFIDAVHGNIARRPIGIDLEFGPYTLALDFKYRTQRRQIELQRFELREDGKDVYKYTTRKDAFESKVKGRETAQFFGLNRKTRPILRNFWPVSVAPLSEILRVEPTSSRISSFRSRYSTFSRELSGALNYFEGQFSNFESLSAFRDKPSRTYLYTGETARYVGVSGSNTAQILAQDAAQRGSGKGSLAESISQWFRQTGIARSISVKSLTSRHFEICVVSNDGSEHNICDVGFGCSQVLPVLLGGLRLFERPERRLNRNVFVVQEPEIHLHPNAQAELGTFFVNLVGDGGQVFIETHSDSLILRVASHVASGQLSPEDVAIFWVNDDEDHSVDPVNISPLGNFDPPWPGGFFPQRSLETTNVARIALRRNPELDRRL